MQIAGAQDDYSGVVVATVVGARPSRFILKICSSPPFCLMFFKHLFLLSELIATMQLMPFSNHLKLKTTAVLL
jgi:hypothetical protein